MYEQFFGFRDEPFRITPDPRYLFLSPKHAEALAHLRLGLSDSSGFVCITGEVGTGKTTLLRAFMAELGSDVAAAYALVPPLSGRDLLRSVCRQFGVPAANDHPLDPLELVEALHAHLVAQHAVGRHCVVVFDEAQALSVELLEQIRLLLNLETETDKLLRIVLVGQPQLRRLLLDPELAQVNQRITLRWHLGPLSRRETAAYVRHRLAVASGREPFRLFTRPALRFLHSVSGGVPRLINMIAHRALLAAFVAREPRITRGLVARAYRELQVVPLPGTMSVGRKVAWAAGGLAVGISLVAVGGPRLERLLDVPRATAVADARAVAPPEPAPSLREAAPAKEPQPVALADPSTAEPADTPVGPEEVLRRLAALDGDASARAATETLLAAWGEQSLGAENVRLPDDLEALAWHHGLQQVVLAGNRSMLRLLDLPAILVLHVPGARTPRYVALTGIAGSRLVLSVAGASVTVDAHALDPYWTREARVLWRDFGGLGALLGHDERGIGVVRLQQLLGRVGLYSGAPTGVFDAPTEAAVIDFQRQHQLKPDGLVGPLTRIVLYAAAGGYSRPALAAS